MTMIFGYKKSNGNICVVTDNFTGNATYRYRTTGAYKIDGSFLFAGRQLVFGTSGTNRVMPRLREYFNKIASADRLNLDKLAIAYMEMCKEAEDKGNLMFVAYESKMYVFAASGYVESSQDILAIGCGSDVAESIYLSRTVKELGILNKEVKVDDEYRKQVAINICLVAETMMPAISGPYYYLDMDEEICPRRLA